MNARTEKVWRALTDPELVSAWLMKNDLQPTVGHSFTFKQEPTPWWDGIVRCEVLESDPHQRLQYSWRSGSGPSGLDTVVTWTLTPTPTGGTRLRLEQSGFEPTNKFAFEGALKGWECMSTERLHAVLGRAA
jgi:uncharacterized protein YndB with AHSA1/START domain